jgi:phage terminase large subunit-like protein
MTNSFKIKKTSKQKEAVKLIVKYIVSLLEGGGRSGKTFIACYIFIVRCIKYPGSRHLMTRFRFSHAKQAICYDTMPKVLELCGLKGKVPLNKTDWFYEFPNGSTIWIGGLDDKERTEKILGNEYATIFLNEASQISYDSYEMIVTRLNPPKGCPGKIIIDYNPPSILHWGYKIFHKRVFPDGRPVPDDNFQFVKMNPADNLENISEEYIKNLENLSVAKRKRFLEGEYSLDSGKLWRRAWIRYWNNILPDFLRVVIGVDPSGSVGGDEVGIIVAGTFYDEGGDLKHMIIDDFSMHGTPEQWANEVAAAWVKYSADCIVAEKNYGGDMVKSTIEGAKKGMNVQLITSSRGKILRAEPVSAQYERSEVYHRIPFMELEDEMCTYDPEVSDSPNRMDACVFAMAELTDGGLSILDVI